MQNRESLGLGKHLIGGEKKFFCGNIFELDTGGSGSLKYRFGKVMNPVSGMKSLDGGLVQSRFLRSIGRKISKHVFKADHDVEIVDFCTTRELEEF